MRDPAVIRARAEASGLLPEKELVTYFQGSVRAAHAALAPHAAAARGCGSVTARGPSGATTRRCRSRAPSPWRPRSQNPAIDQLVRRDR